ncbi:hypothetical protein ACIRG5_38730 [Lentzea sp. NPDC102401]|uniref:hypothetical protein n=1 Tax=Lentzea sp. NPDC102401 TaxID=3364128 RepID=UPI003817FE49
MTLSTNVTIASHELLALQASMRDAQMAAADYYGRTARNDSIDELGTPVRSFLSAIQTVNDLLTNSVGDSETYRSITSSGIHPNTSVILGVKYVRNVAQHLPHVIRPRDDHALIGGPLGMRIYTFWDEIPAIVHDRLRQGTQRLKSDYETRLLGTNVTDTMLDALNFFSDVAPDIPHRDQRGEWTGFPLMSQPGVRDRLHPEEPSDEKAARVWLDERRPNGDIRVICAQLTVDGTQYTLGFTFTGRLSYAPFVETPEQLFRDAAAGYPYVVGDALANTVDRSKDIPHVVQGPVLESRGDIATWTTPVPSGGWKEDWSDGRMTDFVHRLTRTEQGGGLLGSTSYLVRRARRLNALVPYSP